MTHANELGHAQVLPQTHATTPSTTEALDVGGRVIALLSEILDEIRALREQLQRPASDTEKLRALLAAIRGVLGDAEFAAAWVAEASLDSFVPGAAELRRAIFGAIGRKPTGAIRRLGKFIAANVGVVVGEWRLERVGRSRDGATFKVAEVAMRFDAPGTMGRS
jgi:hypothetical protein